MKMLKTTIPVMLAMILWMIGNLLLSLPSHSQGIDPGIEAEKNPICANDSPPMYVKGTECTYNATADTCENFCDGFVIYTSHCRVPDIGEQGTDLQCVDNTGTAFAEYYKNTGCIPTAQTTGPIYCECLPGSPAGDGTADGVAVCGYAV